MSSDLKQLRAKLADMIAKGHGNSLKASEIRQQISRLKVLVASRIGRNVGTRK